MSKSKSKMQTLIDTATKANSLKAQREAIDALIDAVILLSKGQQQLMSDLERLNRADMYRTDVPIT